LEGGQNLLGLLVPTPSTHAMRATTAPVVIPLPRRNSSRWFPHASSWRSISSAMPRPQKYWSRGSAEGMARNHRMRQKV